MVDLGLRLGDCTDATAGLPSLPDRSIDIVIADPPYSAHVEENARSLKSDRRHSASGRGDVVARDFQYKPLTPEARMSAAQEIARVTKRWALIFCDVEGLADWREDLCSSGMLYVRCGIWLRHSGPQQSGDRPAQGFDAVGIFHAPGARLRWNGRGSGAVWNFPIVGDKERKTLGHKTPKPLPLMRELVRLFSDPGEIIADPYAGSGTTGVAAIELGRRFIGWEKEPKFYKPAARRLAAAREQLDLFSRSPRRKRPKQLPLGGAKPDADADAA